MRSDRLAGHLQISESTLKARLRAIGVEDADRKRLAEIWPSVEEHVDTFLTELYARFNQTPSIAQLISQEARLDRLLQAQKQYLHELFCSPIYTGYASRRLNIGLVHYQLRVTPQWYLAAACHFITGHISLFFRLAQTPQQAMSIVVTLTKMVLFDAGLALLSYGHYEDISCQADGAASANFGTGIDEKAAASYPNQRLAKDSRRPMSRLQLSATESQSRMRFIGLTPDDMIHLQQLESVVAAAMPGVLQDFYDYFSTSSDLSLLVPPERVEMLKQQVATYWQELVNSKFDRPYAASRMRIGVIHEEIGLQPQDYLTGLARQAAGLLRAIPVDIADPAASCSALIRAMFFDITFVIDAYMEARAQSLLHAEGLAGRVMKGLSSAVAVVDGDQNILYANEKLVALCGVEPALLRMMHLSEALPMPGLSELFSRLQTGHQQASSQVIAWANGCYQVTITNTSNEQHVGSRETIVVFDEVSRLLRVSGDVSQDAMHYASLAQAVPAVLWQMDPLTESIVSISPMALQLTGIRSSAFLGRPGLWMNFIHDEDRPRFKRCMDLMRQQETGHCQYRIQHQDGREFWVHTSFSIVKAGDNVSDLLSAVTIDITRQKTAEHLRLTAVSQMASSISHLLNNALMAVNGNIELHATDNNGLHNSPLLESALRASKQATTVAKQLQAFAGGQVLQPRMISLNQVLRAEQLVIQELAGTPVKVTFHLEPDLWMCNIDVERLKNVIGNLCTNAQQAMASGGHIRIVTRNLPESSAEFDDPAFGREWVELSISDDGAGMPHSIKQRAIEPFFSDRPIAERSGLGLSIAHGFMSQSGGHMLIESEPGQGATVSLRFPRPAKTLSAEEGVQTSQISVLVVDDEFMVLDVTSAMLRRIGYRVLTAENADEAIKIAEKQCPEILLSDISLGDGVDGVQLAEDIVSRHPGVVVILMSGWVSRTTQVSRTSNFQFLDKPFTRDQLEAAFEKAQHLLRQR